MNDHEAHPGTFWTAHYGSWAQDARIVFRVRNDRIPKERAAEKNIMHYDRLYPATPEEISGWNDTHRDRRCGTRRKGAKVVA